MSDKSLELTDLQMICIDYVHGGVTKNDLCMKYHVSKKLMNKIVNDYDLENKRREQVERALELALSKLSITTAKGLTTGIQVMADRIDQIEQENRRLKANGECLNGKLSRELQNLTMSLVEITKQRKIQEKDNRSKKPNKITVVYEDPQKTLED